MKICIVSPYFTPFIKGSEYGLAQKLTELGHDVTILTSTSRAPREEMVTGEKQSKAHKFKVKYLATIDFDENPIVPSVFFHVLRGKYDVVMLREDYPIMCHLAYFAAKIKRFATLLTTERNYQPRGFKGFFLKFFDLSINRVLRNGVDMYTAHCTAARDFSLKNLGTSRTVFVIPAGIDTDLFKHSPKNESAYLKSGNPKLLTVSRLHEHKGLEYLIKAIGDLAKQWNDVKLYILGKGPERIKLEQMVKDLRLENNIVFMDVAIPNQEMPDLYSECDIYLQPSIVEPFGIAVVEAMACGKPVVGTKIGGMLDTIVDGVTGFSVPPSSSIELSKAIAKLLKDRTLLLKMGENARKEALRYDWNLITQQYLDVIDRIVKH